MASEPMTNKRLAEIDSRVKNAWAMQAVGPANLGDLEPWQLQAIAVAYVDDVADLLIEVERLRAENAAMRPVVEAVAEHVGVYVSEHFRQCAFCGNGAIESRIIAHADDCEVARARAFLAAAEQAAASEGE